MCTPCGSFVGRFGCDVAAVANGVGLGDRRGVCIVLYDVRSTPVAVVAQDASVVAITPHKLTCALTCHRLALPRLACVSHLKIKYMLRPLHTHTHTHTRSTVAVPVNSQT